jgi:hypothetical protein
MFKAPGKYGCARLRIAQLDGIPQISRKVIIDSTNSSAAWSGQTGSNNEKTVNPAAFASRMVFIAYRSLFTDSDCFKNPAARVQILSYLKPTRSAQATRCGPRTQDLPLCAAEPGIHIWSIMICIPRNRGSRGTMGAHTCLPWPFPPDARK